MCGVVQFHNGFVTPSEDDRETNRQCPPFLYHLNINSVTRLVYTYIIMMSFYKTVNIDCRYKPVLKIDG